MNDLQNSMYVLLCEIDDICRKNNIRYYLHAGSVIGAVRHEGIIPWDDDIDIAMTRSEWNRFCDAFESMNFKNRALVTSNKYKDYKFTYPQYKDTSGTVLYYSGLYADFPLGAFVDIIILDPVKNNDDFIKAHVENLKLLAELKSDFYVVNRNSSFKKWKLLKYLTRFINKEKICRYLEKKLELVDDVDCDGYIQRIGVYPVYWDKKFFEEPEYAKINDRVFPVPTNVKEYLRYTYGDSWMIFLDDAGKAGHGFKFLPNITKQEFRNDYKYYINVKKYNYAWEQYKYWSFKAIKYEDNVRICNSLRMAELYALAVNKRIEGIDLEKLYINKRFSEIFDILKVYFEYQLDSRFIKDNIGIPVNGVIAYYACMVLVLKGEYYNAEKILKVYNGLKKSKAEEIKNAIEISRKLSIAVYEENEDTDKIRELLDVSLSLYPHHVDFIAAKCNLLLKENNLNALKVKKICQENLEYHKNNAWLLKYLADSELLLENISTAIELYRSAYSNTNNGMLRLQIMEIGKKYEVQLNENASDKIHNEEYILLVKTAQEKILTLLGELDEICKRNGIPYFLGGYLAAEAVELGTFAPECCSAYIVLNPNYRKQFIDAVKQGLKDNRFLESFESNKNYPDFSMRYGDTETVVFDLREEGFYQYNGLNITILFVKPKKKNNLMQKFNAGLYAAIEAAAFSSVFNNTSNKKIIAGILAKMMFLILGKKLSKNIVWNLIYTKKKKSNILTGSIKTYWYKEINLPELDFSKKQVCSLNDFKFYVPVNYIQYIRGQVISNWDIGTPIGKVLKADIIAAMDVSAEAYLKVLINLRLKNKFFKNWSRLVRCNKCCSKYTWYGTRYAWKMANRSFERLSLWQKYAPLKYNIMNLYKKDQFDTLEIILSDYIDCLVKNAKNAVAIIFDEEIFWVTWEMFRREGRLGIIKNIIPKIPAMHLNQILLSCGSVSRMKKAEINDQEKILKYLEQDIENGLYMYADISKYGLNSDNLLIWYDTDDIGIRMVVMKYHNSFQVYTNRGFNNVDGVLDLIYKFRPYGIAGRKDIILNLEKQLIDVYKSEYGVIFKGKDISKEKLMRALDNSEVKIELAKETDAENIAELICMDKELGSVYTVSSLTSELKERINTGMGRSYIIRADGKIVAHNATYAESDKFVIVSGLMVHPDYRDTDYAYWIDLKSSLEFQNEGKSRFFFALNNKIIRWHKRLGTQIVAEYGKLSLKDKK